MILESLKSAKYASQAKERQSEDTEQKGLTVWDDFADKLPGALARYEESMIGAVHVKLVSIDVSDEQVAFHLETVEDDDVFGDAGTKFTCSAAREYVGIKANPVTENIVITTTFPLWKLVVKDPH